MELKQSQTKPAFDPLPYGRGLLGRKVKRRRLIHRTVILTG